MSDLSPTEIRMRCVEAIIGMPRSEGIATAERVIEDAGKLAAWIAEPSPASKPERDLEAERLAIDAGAREKHAIRLREMTGKPFDPDDDLIRHAGHSGER